MRLKNTGNFCVGQVPRTSHVAIRLKKHISDASVPRCHGLLQQAPPQVCSWLVLEGVLHVVCTRYLDTRTCFWTTLYVSPPFFSAGSSIPILEDCLLLLAAAVFYYYSYFVIFSSFSAKEYAPGPHGGRIRSNKRSSLLLYVKLK